MAHLVASGGGATRAVGALRGRTLDRDMLFAGEAALETVPATEATPEPAVP